MVGPTECWAAEAQRRQQRQREAAERERLRYQCEQQRRQRAQERERARHQREQKAAYRQQREADAQRRAEQIEARVAQLTGLLAAGCRAPAFTTAALLRPEQVAPFAPGRLAFPVPMPDPAGYPPESRAGGWSFRGGRRARADARDRYERDRGAAQAAEAERQRQLAAYRQQYDQWAAAELAEIRRHNGRVAALAEALRDGVPDAVVDYAAAALYASAD